MSASAGRPWVLAEATWAEVAGTRYELAILPWGATEAHNRHLPYATDSIQSEAVAVAAAEIAWQAGSRVVVLPTVPLGVNTGQLEIPFCLNLNPTTQTALLRDLIRSLEPHGIRKLVILNGHGGNDFRQIIRELQPETPVLLCQVNWYACLDPAPFFDAPGDHAGELETSVMLHLAPSLVRPLSQAGPGTARTFRVRAFREGWAWTQRRWIDVTGDTGVGDPSASTAEKGKRFFDEVTERIATFLSELAAADPSDFYR
jgi:creatinine amidohydrolase